ncbi:MAG: penicillin-binding transpeptidase domain-containing protein, partial [Desulforhopalus sp.]
EPSFIRKIESADGTVFDPEKERKKHRVLGKQVLNEMQVMLNRVVTAGTGQKVAEVPDVRGGKTGTSDENRDAWFVGFTQSYTTGVWVGNDRNHSLGKSESGGTTAAPIWRDFMVSVGK